MENKLINEVKIGDYDEVVQVFLVNNSYFSVVYRDKEEYYTKDQKLANVVGNIILTFYQNLTLGNEIFTRNLSEEEKWKSLLRFLKDESKDSDIGKDLCLGIYRSIEEAYYDTLDNIAPDKSLASKRNTIRNKDNLMRTINKILSLVNPSEADKNLGRYKKVRNKYIEVNPHLNLSLL